MKKFSPGEIVRVKVNGLMYTPEGFAAGSKSGADGLLIFEMIDVVTFPSFNDFLGKSLLVKEGDLLTIIDYVGRPHQISKDTKWFKYDIYNVLAEGQVRQIFSQNICRMSDNV